MQRRWPIVVATVALSLMPLSARAGEFEGILHMTTGHSDAVMKHARHWYLKGDKGRLELSCGKGRTSVMAFDATTRTVQMEMPG